MAESQKSNYGKSGCKKTRYAKAYGVKSNLFVGDTIYTTTFGKKNESKLSKSNNLSNSKGSKTVFCYNIYVYNEQ